MVCRIALGIGRAPSEVRRLPARDYELLARYWAEEPWGAYRDNLHASAIAAAVYNASGRFKKWLSMDHFVLKPPSSQPVDGGRRLAGMLSMLAGKKQPRKKQSNC